MVSIISVISKKKISFISPWDFLLNYDPWWWPSWISNPHKNHTVCKTPQQVHSIQRNFQSSANQIASFAPKLQIWRAWGLFFPAVSENDIDADRSKLMTIITLSFEPFQLCHYRQTFFVQLEWNLSKSNSK